MSTYGGRLKVLVVDDSALMRRMLRQILEAAGGIEVSVARSGLDALDLIRREEPDVVTLDINMPEMDGLSCLAEIMRTAPRPVVMVSSLTEQGALVTLEALELGAVDFVAKPGGTVSLNLDQVAEELVAKVRHAAQARVATGRRRHAQPVPAGPVSGLSGGGWDLEHAVPDGGAADLVLVGSSTGGPALLGPLLSVLPAGFPAAVVVAQHLPASFTPALARRLDELCAVHVVEVTIPTPVEPSTVYIGRGDADVVIFSREGDVFVKTVPASSAYRWHPSVDRLVATAQATLDPQRIIGVMLTGMGDDGAEEMAKLHALGGRTVAESRDTAVVWGMPGELVRRGGASVTLPGDRIGPQILAWIQ